MKNRVIAPYLNSGYFIDVEHGKGFVHEKGNGVPVLCFHGVPASSYLYRKVIGALAQLGFRGIAFDLLGTGLSDRPVDFAYNWTGLGKWSTDLIQELKLDGFHLVLHDIGGPIGCEVIANMPEKVLSITILNTPLYKLGQFRKPFPMYFFERKVIGELFMKMTTPFFFHRLMQWRGIHQKDSFDINDARAYVDLLKGSDQGRSFLKIMRSFEATQEKEDFYTSTLRAIEVPKQIIWGRNDPALTLHQFGRPLQDSLGIEKFIPTDGSHFLQEDYSSTIALEIEKLTR